MMPSQSDPGLDRDLEGYLAWRTAQVARAPDLATMTARVAAGVGMTGRVERTTILRTALIAAVLMLIAVLAVGAAIVASKPSRTVTAIPSPTVGLASPTPNLAKSFTSPRTATPSAIRRAGRSRPQSTHGAGSSQCLEARPTSCRPVGNRVCIENSRSLRRQPKAQASRTGPPPMPSSRRSTRSSARTPTASLERWEGRR